MTTMRMATQAIKHLWCPKRNPQMDQAYCPVSDFAFYKHPQLELSLCIKCPRLKFFEVMDQVDRILEEANG